MATIVVSTDAELQSLIGQIDQARIRELSVEQSGAGWVVSYPDDMAAAMATANPALPPPPEQDTRIDAIQNARLDAIEASIILAGRLNVKRVEELPALSPADEGAAYYSPNGYKSKPGIVVWDGTSWRRMKDGNQVHANEGGI